MTIEISCLKTVRILPILGFPKLLVGIFCDSSDSLFYSCSFVRHSYVNGWISLFGRAQLRTGLVLTVTDVLTSWGHHALKSLNPSLHYILARLFVNLHIIFESMDGNLWCYHLNETSFAGFIQSLEFLKKVLKFVQQFSRPGKSLENRDEVYENWVFIQSYNKSFISEFFFTFVKSYSISSICLQHTMKKALFPH